MSYREYSTIFLTLVLLVSCTALPIITEKKPEFKDGIAEEYYNRALISMEEKNFAFALTLLIRAQRRDPENPKINREVDKLVSSLNSKAVYKNEMIQIGKGLLSPLQFILTYERGNESYPVADMPVFFFFNKGEGVLTENAVTNDLGLAKCYVESIKDFEGMIKIQALVSLNSDDQFITLNSLTREYIFSSISLFDLRYSISMLIDMENPVEKEFFPSFCNRALEIFTENEFSHVTCDTAVNRILFTSAFTHDKPSIQLLANSYGAEIVILLKVTSSFASSPSTDFFFSNAHAEIKIIDTREFIVQFEEETFDKGAGQFKRDSEYQAILNAINRLNDKLDGYIQQLRRTNGIHS
jgi:hypothetical protein